MIRRNFLIGYKTRAYGHACVPNFEMLEVPLKNARFLTFMQVVSEDTRKYAKLFADNITAKNPYVEFLRSRI